MRAVTLESFDRSPQLQEAPAPQISPNEMLVRVHASSINALDVKIAAGMLQGMMEYQFPVTIGRDLAGVVEQVGSEVTRYRAGDEVFGFLGFTAEPVLHDGAPSPTAPSAPRTCSSHPSPRESATLMLESFPLPALPHC